MTIEDKIVRAYGAANQSGVPFGVVSIHVGQEVWDWMHERCESSGLDTAKRNRLWGFPVFLEAAWEPDRVVVRSDQEIW